MDYVKLVIDRYGDPCEVINLVRENLNDLPEPNEDELILENLASPIHPSVIYMINGLYKDSSKLPLVPGNDTVSRVYKRGAKANRFDVGQRVIPCITHGAYSQYMTVKESQVLTDIPDEIDNETASQFIIVGVTAYQLVTSVVALNPDEWALQTAAASTLGRLAIQIAKEKGIKLINVVRRKEQVEELKAIGADHVIVYNSENEEALHKEIMDVTGGKGIKYAFDAVGGQIGTFAFNSLCRGGTIALYGILSGKPIEVSASSIVTKKTSVIGYSVMDWMANETLKRKLETARELIRLLKEKKVNIKYDSVYEYKDYKRAFEEAKAFKKVVLVPKMK